MGNFLLVLTAQCTPLLNENENLHSVSLTSTCAGCAIIIAGSRVISSIANSIQYVPCKPIYGIHRSELFSRLQGLTAATVMHL